MPTLAGRGKISTESGTRSGTGDGSGADKRSSKRGSRVSRRLPASRQDSDARESREPSSCLSPSHGQQHHWQKATNRPTTFHATTHPRRARTNDLVKSTGFERSSCGMRWNTSLNELTSCPSRRQTIQPRPVMIPRLRRDLTLAKIGHAKRRSTDRSPLHHTSAERTASRSP